VQGRCRVGRAGDWCFTDRRRAAAAVSVLVGGLGPDLGVARWRVGDLWETGAG